MSTSPTIKGYELHERIGSGGFGVVHRATQSTIGREVAIKIILPHFANQPDFIRRFETEAQIIARLEHLHIVPLYDYWRDLDGAYLVMRWLRGGNLRDALVNTPFQLEAAALLIDQVASALAVAHRNGVVHRDLKPANILLDEDGNAYLSDFGIAKDVAATDGALTGSGVVLGSPDYLSPEQARSDPVTPQTDIYSLGVMLYELLTGQHPFPNCSSVERMYKHLNEPLPLITSLPADVADGINGIVQKATAKNPAQRYADVLALAADFRREAALIRQSGDSIVEQLTLREQEILQMIVDGCSNKDIAQRLFVTMATVKWHIHSVYQKLHVRSRVQAIVKARQINLIVSDNAAGSSVTADSTLVAFAEPENPYKGLRAFQIADANDFFGRERLIQHIMQRLGEHDKLARFLAVIGPSGSGKSSVVKAGVMPALWRGDLRGSDRWFVIEMKPGVHPLDELEIALTRVAANQTSNLREHLERDGRGLVRIASLILPDDDSELVIVIDQFEEVFTLVEDEAKRTHFIDLICQSVTDPRSRVRIIITLRADFYDRPLQYPDFGELVRSRMETVMPLSSDELESAIAKPAARVGITFEPGLVATIAGDVHYQPGALPLLQYALTELFEQRANRVLTHEAYLALGGAAGALAKRAEGLYHEQDAAGQDAIRQMFLRLIALGEGAEDTRRRVPRSELLSLSDDDLMDEMLDTYAAYRLLTLDHDPASRRPTVEIAHEAILREWERLRTWLNESRHDIRQQRMLSASAVEWSQAGRDPSYLLHGSRLEQMAGWAAESKLALTQAERSFLETSIAERTRQENAEQERQRRELTTQRQLAEQQLRSANRLRYLVVGLTVFTGVAVLLALFAYSREQQAQEARSAAQRTADVNHSLVLASSAIDAYGHDDSILALQLALESLNLEDPPPEAEIALREIAQGGGLRSVLYGHQNRVSAVTISPDGRFILSGSCTDAEETCTTSELILWDAQHQVEIRRMQGIAGRVMSIVFGADSQTALSASSDGTVTMWSLMDGKVLRRFEGHTAGINGLAISPDGKTFVSASDDMTLIQWNIEMGSVIQRYEGHTDAVDCVVFSADGQTLLSGSADGTMIQWDVASGNPLLTFEDIGSRVNGVAFVSGNRVISITRDGGLYLWDGVTGTLLREHNTIANPSELALSPDGRTVFFSELGHLRAWDINQWQPAYGLSFYKSEKQSISSLAVSTQGKLGVYGTEQAYLVVWDMPSSGEIRRFGNRDERFTFAVVSPDNRYLMLGTGGGEVIMQDRATGEEIRRFSGAEGFVWRLVFSPDAQQLMVASADWYGASAKGSFILWDVATGARIRSFTGFDYLPTWVAFSPDGQFVIGSTMQWGDAWSETVHGDTIVWNRETGEEVLRLNTDQWVNVSLFTEDQQYIITGSGRQGISGIVVWDAKTGEPVRHILSKVPVLGLKLVPDTTTALAGMGSGEIILFDYETGAEIRRFCCHGNWVRYLDLSSDQRYVISADQSAVVILWDYATGEEIRRFYGHESFAWEARFSPDGKTTYSAGWEGSVIEWQIAEQSLDELIAWLRANRYIPDFTCAERIQYRIEPLCSV